MARMRVEHIGGGQYMIGNHPLYSDWDYPGGAQWLGWSVRRVQRVRGQVRHLARASRVGCRHDGTDGTIDCPDCGVTVGAFLRAAREFLDRLAT